MASRKKKKEKYYEVIGVDSSGRRYKLGYTSNKSAFQRGSGWPMSKLRFIVKYR